MRKVHLPGSRPRVPIVDATNLPFLSYLIARLLLYPSATKMFSRAWRELDLHAAAGRQVHRVGGVHAP